MDLITQIENVDAEPSPSDQTGSLMLHDPFVLSRFI